MVGVDEVGRGCLAGPLLVVAARAQANLPTGIKDSKTLSRIQREKLYDLLALTCVWGEGWVTCREIDKFGLGRCLKLGVARAINSLGVAQNEEIIIDGSVNYLPKKYVNGSNLIDGDALRPIISAASIIAKVNRDRYMIKLSAKHPNYSFDTNVGYGSSSHFKALEKFGPVKNVHRLSFEPLRRIVSI